MTSCVPFTIRAHAGMNVALCKKTGLTQTEYAKKIGKNQPTGENPRYQWWLKTKKPGYANGEKLLNFVYGQRKDLANTQSGSQSQKTVVFPFTTSNQGIGDAPHHTWA